MRRTNDEGAVSLQECHVVAVIDELVDEVEFRMVDDAQRGVGERMKVERATTLRELFQLSAHRYRSIELEKAAAAAWHVESHQFDEEAGRWLLDPSSHWIGEAECAVGSVTGNQRRIEPARVRFQCQCAFCN